MVFREREMKKSGTPKTKFFHNGCKLSSMKEKFIDLYRLERILRSLVTKTVNETTKIFLILK